MRIVGLEEHLVTHDVVAAWRRADPDLGEPMMRWALESDLTASLLDLDEGRLRAMDDAGIDTAVLSLTTPGLQNLPRAEAVALQQPTNDLVAEAVARHPDRLQSFAALAMPDPAAAAAELRRTVCELGFHGALVNARTGDRYLDAVEFWDVFEAAEALRAPIYLHPRAPAPAVREVYYGSADRAVGDLLATGGIGWHYDAGLTLLRMMLAGVFDRFPQLQVVLGHWGEVVLFYLDRIGVLDAVAGLERPVAGYFGSNVYVTPGGHLQPRLPALGAGDRRRGPGDVRLGLPVQPRARRLGPALPRNRTGQRRGPSPRRARHLGVPGGRHPPMNEGEPT